MRAPYSLDLRGRVVLVADGMLLRGKRWKIIRASRHFMRINARSFEQAEDYRPILKAITKGPGRDQQHGGAIQDISIRSDAVWLVWS